MILPVVIMTGLPVVLAVILLAPNPVSALLALGVIFLAAFAVWMQIGDRIEKRENRR